jgi:hypothetical protein
LLLGLSMSLEVRIAWEMYEWTVGMSIANTIVPWTSEWLAHYEIWLATGDWQGGGEWPPRPESGTEAAKDPPAQAA